MVVDVLERDGHDLGGTIDRHVTEELQPEAGRQVVALTVAASLLENGLWAERGCQVPAWIGPEMNSQNGSKSWNTAAFGS